MEFKKSLLNAFEIVKLNRNIITTVANDQNALIGGLLIIATAGALSALGQGSIGGIVISAVLALIGSFIGFGILHLVARAFKGKAEFMSLYRVGSHAALLNWAALFVFIPLFGNLVALAIGIWSIVVGVIIVETLYTLSRVNAVIVVLLPTIVLIGIQILVSGLAPNSIFSVSP